MRIWRCVQRLDGALAELPVLAPVLIAFAVNASRQAERLA
jgi:hypothetical protein